MTTSHEIPKPGIGSRARRSDSGNGKLSTPYVSHISPSNKPPKPAFKCGYRGRVHLYLYDECPRLGCGWRFVNICVGHKWVKVNSGHGRNTRISRQLFDRVYADTRSILIRNIHQRLGAQL